MLGGELPVEVHQGKIALSEHRLVTMTIFAVVCISYANCLGRVAWTSNDAWDCGLERVAPTLAYLAVAVEGLLGALPLSPPMDGGTASKKQRWQLLDAAAWARDVIYVLFGRAAAAVRAVLPRVFSPAGYLPLKGPAAYLSHRAFKEEVSRCTRVFQARAVDKYRQMRRRDPGGAERFLTRIFARKRNFIIALTDPTTGVHLSEQQMVQELVRDLFERAHNELHQNPKIAEEIDINLSSIRSNGAVPTRGDRAPQESAGTNDDPVQRAALYTEDELAQVLSGMRAMKHCIKGAYAALKAAVPEGRRLTLALVNLGKWVGLTSTLWSVRQFAHIRKNGPRVVQRINNLRPLSICSDMAQVQDRLWVQLNWRSPVGVGRWEGSLALYRLSWH